MDLQSYLAYLASFLTVGNFVIIDLIAATTNALNGALLAQRPDYYRGKQWTVVGIIIMAIFGGIGGGTTRDIIAGKSTKQFIRGEWFVGTAVLTSVIYVICYKYLQLPIWPSTLISFAIGFVFRVVALWRAWEEPMPWFIPAHVMGVINRRAALKEKMQPGWEEPDI
jgi:uncharacterized membrane protein YeiH